MNKIIMSIGLLLFIAGCAPAPIECPKVNCPTVTCPQPTIEDNSLYLYFINVGQGDSQLVKYGENEMLIDCGKNSEGPAIVDFLKGKGVKQLEFLMITHPESDHLGGCDNVLKDMNVGVVITNGEESDTQSYKEVKSEINTEQLIIAKEGMSWSLGDAEITILQANNYLNDTNQNSIVSKVTLGQVSALFTGDCDRECEDLLMGKDINSTILKVAHHGSRFGTEIDFLEKVNPSIGIISVGADNSYGHPSYETLDRLSQEGVVVYRTDVDGTIAIGTDGAHYAILSTG